MNELEKRIIELEYQSSPNDSTLQIRLPKALHKAYLEAYPMRGQATELIRNYIIKKTIEKL